MALRTDGDRFRWLAQQDRTAFLRQAIDAAMDGFNVSFDILAAIRQLRQEMMTMSVTLSQQLSDATDAIKADMEALASDMTAIQAEIANLHSQMQPGTQITQAQVDALAALKAKADAVKTTADAMAAPAPAAAAPAAPAAPAATAPAADPAAPAAPAAPTA